MKPLHPQAQYSSLREFTRSIMAVQKSTKKTVKVMKGKERPRKCHRMEETKERDVMMKT